MSKTFSSMRSSAGSNEILEEICSEILECKVCFERYAFDHGARGPRNLPCGHLICLGCVGALSHPISGLLECPFCRKSCDSGATYECQALVDLKDLMASFSQEYERKALDGQTSGAGVMHLQCVFGGWDRIVNPTGVTVFGSEILVVHAGLEKVTVFSNHGKYLRSFGRDIRYPLGVAATPSGHVVVTDGGDCSVKVFSCTGSILATIFGPFALPWGIAVDSSGYILVSDTAAGNLWQIVLDFQRAVVLIKMVVLQNLKCPRAVASCPVSGCILVLEHAGNQRSDMSIKLKLFSKDFLFLKQVDGFSLDPTSSMRLNPSSAMFNGKGEVIVADELGVVWCLGDLQVSPALLLLVREGLKHPVGLAMRRDGALITVDGDDHTVKVYSTGSDDLRLH